jgi:hypothetical protein
LYALVQSATKAHLLFAVPPPELGPRHGFHVPHDRRPLHDGGEQAGDRGEPESAHRLLEVASQDGHSGDDQEHLQGVKEMPGYTPNNETNKRTKKNGKKMSEAALGIGESNE